MKKMILSLIIISMLVFPITAFATVLSSNSPAQEVSLSSSYTSIAPSIDGSIDYGEWQLIDGLDFTEGDLYARNDGIRLYLLFNVLSDTVNDPSDDYFWISFDSDHDGQITPNVDLNYGLVAGNIRYQYYLGDASWTGVQSSTRSSRGIGFGCFLADGTLSFNPGSGFLSSLSCLPHRVYEFGFDLDEINATAGSSIDMGFRIFSKNPSFTVDYPANFISDFSDLLTINLASPPTPLYTPADEHTDFVIPSGEHGIEITQAVQNRMNSLPLVEDKETVARLYVQTTTSVGSTPRPVTTYLYGTRGGVDLPGSPLAKSFNAPTSLNRNLISGSANFNLPKSWEFGTVSFSGLVRNSFGYEDSHPSFTISFTPKEVPTVWIIPVNTGTTGSPNVVSDSQILSQESAMKTVFPVKDINFVRKPWTSIGACPGCSLTTINQKLNQYFAGVFFAWLFSSGSFELPDQIYGFTPSGGGLSDPQWFSGTGLVASGFIGSSRELTMAHEINHNLDLTSTGTWGRHVGNPNSNTWNWNNGSTNPNIDFTYGCGASGTDSTWPTPPNTDDIARSLNKYDVFGFDTRSPQKVVPGTMPDFMSYCQNAGTPTKWVSGYRWENLFNYYSAPSPVTVENSLSRLYKLGYKPDQGIVEHMHISGTINKDGSGTIDLVQILIALSSPVNKQGNSNIDLQDANGNSLGTYPFEASFVDVEGESTDSVKFFLQVPFNPVATKMILNYQGNSLDTFSSPNILPTVSFTSPAPNDVWSGLKEVKWIASDAESFTLLYSPDDGKEIWLPVASGIKETSYLVDVSSLSPSIIGKFRIIATNGFNTSIVDSPNVEVVNNPPSIEIFSPSEEDEVFDKRERVPLHGRATDSEEGILPGNQTYWKVGDTPLGSGTDISAVLSEGTHVITFGAEDSHGAIAEKSVTIKVGDPDQSSTTTKPSPTSQGIKSSIPGFGIDSFLLVTIIVLIGVQLRKRKRKI